jgi:mRNA interferase RelE/StbE
MLQEIGDRRTRQIISDRISQLADGPEKRGQALIGPLMGYRSLRAAGQRFRIIYRIQQEQVIVYVVVGIRREGDKSDIYALAQRLVRLGLLEPPVETPE